MSSDLILATAGYDHVIRFWDASSGLTKTSIEFPGT
jgi:WD40 repeat protein